MDFGTKAIQELSQIIWKRHSETEIFTGDGMNKSQLGRMQRETRCPTAVVDHRCSERLTVFQIPTDKMASFREVDSNLVRTTRFELALDKGIVAQIFQRANVCDRTLTDFGIINAAAATIASIADKIRFDRFLDWMTVHDGPINSMRGMSAELTNQAGFRLVCPSEYEQAARITIETVNDP